MYAAGRPATAAGPGILMDLSFAVILLIAGIALAALVGIALIAGIVILVVTQSKKKK